MSNQTSASYEKLRKQFEPGTIVIIDKDCTASCVAKVISQTPQRLYTKVECEGVQWEVMTARCEIHYVTP